MGNKKIIGVVIVGGLVILNLGLASCSSKASNPYQEKSSLVYQLVESDVSIKASVLPNQVLDLSIMNQSSKHCSIGEDYAIEYNFEGDWYVVPIKPNTAFPAIGYIIEPGEERSFTVELKEYFDVLPSGHYRIIKEMILRDDVDEFANENNRRVLVAEFDI